MIDYPVCLIKLSALKPWRKIWNPLKKMTTDLGIMLTMSSALVEIWAVESQRDIMLCLINECEPFWHRADKILLRAREM